MDNSTKVEAVMEDQDVMEGVIDTWLDGIYQDENRKAAFYEKIIDTFYDDLIEVISDRLVEGSL